MSSALLPAPLRENLAIPVMGAPMFLVSGVELVVAQCTAGVIGSYPALNSRPASVLRDDLQAITEQLESSGERHAAFAVNLIAHATNTRLEHDLEVCIDLRVPIVVTSLGARPEINDAIHSYGGVVLHDVTTDRFARKAVDRGADGLVAVAAGAGGHGGTMSPFALVEDIRRWFDGPLLLGGGIATGRSIAAAITLGADLAYVGSAFIATRESNATETYKQMVVDGGAQDIVGSDAFTGVFGNFLRASIIASGLDPDDLSRLERGRIVLEEGSSRAWRDVWGGGHGIGAVDRVASVGEVVTRLRAEFADGRVSSLVSTA
jgi:nitronate monooxygenase